MGLSTKKLGLRGLYVVAIGLLISLPAQLIHSPSDPAPTPAPPSTTPTAAPSAGRIISRSGLLLATSTWTPGSLAATPTVPPPNMSPLVAASVPKAKKGVIRDIANKTLTVDDVQYPLRTYNLLAAPNDPAATQWWVNNTSLSQAWDVPVGSQNTVLAVIDTGFAMKHEEFANRWYTNPGETGPALTENPSQLNCTARGLPISASCNLIDDDGDGIVDNETGAAKYENPSRLNCTDQQRPLTKDCNNVDDDGNGLVDDVSGWDFANNDNSPQAGELNPTGTGTTHGTETAGVAAATGNNAKGTAGVDWHTKILPIQALSDDSYGDTLGVGRAIHYATSQRANVISLSLGSTLPDDYVRKAIAEAVAAGIVIVASSGNSPCDCMVYPANYPEVVSVGALDTNNQPASFSSYGTNLDILAPGTQIVSPAWSSAYPTNGYASNLAGTSFAAPIVSGLMTRLLSQRPTMTPLQLMAAVTENTNRLTLSANVPRTSQLGYGSLNASKATSRVNSARNTTIAYNFTPVSKGTFLNPGAPADVSGSYGVQRCEDNQIGTTPLYEMTGATSSTSTFWSISQSEVWQAQSAGYTARLFAEVCLQQPQDTSDIHSSINLFKEFRNVYRP